MSVILILVTVLLVIQIAVARWERRMVWPYGTLEETALYDAPTGYGSFWVLQATQAGCKFLGWAPDLKGEKYQVSYGMLVTAERDCFVLVGGGTIFGIPLAGTWIYSQSSEGRWFYTTDNQACVSIDISRNWLSQLDKKLSFPELLASHRSWINRHAPRGPMFERGQEIQTLRTARENHYARLSKQGLIEFSDDTCVYWRYTLLGATMVAFLGYFIGLMRGMTFGRLPRTA